ncbi:hypothetical protein [Flexibacterium corallicola]|uniref:hypothetical protein n=1 Tax=Flexibacterium corallicola TaxID=3037259 RepID=UPI00286F45FA|nr:hypothetical protein [Pseudovibrio sp. M1P-2-3]
MNEQSERNEYKTPEAKLLDTQDLSHRALQFIDAEKSKLTRKISDTARALTPVTKNIVTDVTRTEQTHSDYLDRGRSLLQSYLRAIGQPTNNLEMVDPEEFVAYLFSRRPEWAGSTWRYYKQAAIEIVAAMPFENSGTALSILESDYDSPIPQSSPYYQKTTSDPENIKSSPRQTSSAKSKRFPKEDFDKLQNYLQNFSRSKWAVTLSHWLTAGILTGLRPTEWQVNHIAQFNGDGGKRDYLLVGNAKATNGRATGSIRTLDITELSAQDKASIQFMSSHGSAWFQREEFTLVQNACSALLTRASQKLFKRSQYCLYTLRHQFIANQKKIHPPAHVAALVGHNDIRTAQSHYGKRRSGWRLHDQSGTVHPIKSEVQFVKKIIRHNNETIRKKVAAGLISPAKAKDMYL